MIDMTMRELMDREAIRDCLYRYCRGIDRADEAALRSCYWPDAHDSHGAYRGTAEGFIQAALGIFKSEPRNIHQISNILIEFANPATALVESYFNAYQRGPDAQGIERQVHIAGRYCDRFEKRNDEWRVSDRTVVYDWLEDQVPPDQDEITRFGPRGPIGSAWPEDPVYVLLRGAIADPRTRAE